MRLNPHRIASTMWDGAQVYAGEQGLLARWTGSVSAILPPFRSLGDHGKLSPCVASSVCRSYWHRDAPKGRHDNS